MPFVKADELVENRKLSEFPELTNKDGSVNLEWPSQFETYLSEHFAFRQELVTLDSLEKAYVFKTSSNDKVIVGDNNWLYFSSTLDEYLSMNTLSERRINNTAKTLQLIQNYAQNRGAEFLFITAPNKNTVYPENMPSRYIKSNDPNNLEKLNAVLDDYSVETIDLTELFSQQDKVLYHSRDSHWTNEGAVLVHNAIMDKLQIEHNDFSGTDHHTENIWRGDLDSMIFPTIENLSEQEEYDIDFNFEYISSFQTSDDMSIKTYNPNGSANILMFRDSFGRSLYPFIAENAKQTEFSREIPYQLGKIDSLKADFVILEIVQRNIPNLTEKAPVMAALPVSMEISADIIPNENNICKTTDQNGMLKIYGVLDESYFEPDSDIFITLENEDGIYCYEAFPIYEAELFGEENQNDFGYSLLADTTAIPNGEYAVNAYIGSVDNLVCTDSMEIITIEN